MTAYRRCRSVPRGFTLPELLAVVAVTAIVGAVGVSAYRTYAVRAEIANGIAATLTVRDRVATAFKTTGLPPRDRLAAGVDSSRDPAWGDYVADIDIINGRIEIRFGRAADAAIAGRTLSITPFETIDQRVVWVCGNRLPDVGLKPLGFAGGAQEPVQVDRDRHALSAAELPLVSPPHSPSREARHTAKSGAATDCDLARFGPIFALARSDANLCHKRRSVRLTAPAACGESTVLMVKRG